jgi:hypothetical protein
MILAFFLTRYMPRDWAGLHWSVFRPLIVCGQQSLEVFCFGVFLAVIAHVVLVEVSSDIWMQILVSAVGIAMMTGLAFYGAWSKKVDKKPARAPTTPAHRVPDQRQPES